MSSPRSLFVKLPGGGYALTRLEEGVRLEFRYVRREHHQLFAEVDVLCDWESIQKDDQGSLSCADLNLSSQPARLGRAKYCAERSRSKPETFDWIGLFDDGCRKVIQAERETAEGLVLDDAPDDGPPQDLDVYGLSLPLDGSSYLVADGDKLKSLIVLLALGEMAKRGLSVALLDWEWTAARHKARKRKLFGTERLDTLRYMRCRNPITHELDHIRRFCDEHAVQYVGIDSVGAAVDGKLVDDDVARAFNRALDQLPPALVVAHVPKNGPARDPGSAVVKPFGSTFFANYARMVWSVTKQATAEAHVVAVVINSEKQNDGARVKPVGLEFTFTPDQIHLRRVDPATVETFADRLPLQARLTHLLKAGPLTLAAMATALDAKVDSVTKSVQRGKGKVFTKVLGPDGIDRWALLERRIA